MHKSCVRKEFHQQHDARKIENYISKLESERKKKKRSAETKRHLSVSFHCHLSRASIGFQRHPVCWFVSPLFQFESIDICRHCGELFFAYSSYLSGPLLNLIYDATLIQRYQSDFESSQWRHLRFTIDIRSDRSTISTRDFKIGLSACGQRSGTLITKSRFNTDVIAAIDHLLSFHLHVSQRAIVSGNESVLSRLPLGSTKQRREHVGYAEAFSLDDPIRHSSGTFVCSRLAEQANERCLHEDTESDPSEQLIPRWSSARERIRKTIER